MLNDLTEIREQHRKAMDIADRADYLARRDHAEEARKLYHEAFVLEAEAAQTMPDEFWRSVYLCSAASLGLLCQEYHEAEKLAALGLTLDTDPYVSRNLRDLLETLRIHLELTPVATDDDDKEPLVIRGRLDAANTRQKDIDFITIMDEDGKDTWFFVASSEIINTTVRKLWNTYVEVTGIPINARVLRLIEIRAVEPAS